MINLSTKFEVSTFTMKIQKAMQNVEIWVVLRG